jgi:flagellar hook-associated protein 3 FlgL
MRISTAGMHEALLARLMERTVALERTQNQLASGKRILTPADDPSGAVRALDIDRALAESQQYARNIDAATNRLSLEEQTLANTTSLLQRVRDLIVQANNARPERAGADRHGNRVAATRADGSGEHAGRNR